MIISLTLVFQFVPGLNGDGNSNADNDDGNNAWVGSKGIEYTLMASGSEYAVTSCDKKAADEIVIAKSYNDKPVTQILTKAFENCNKIIVLEIPETIKIIEKAAFSGCDKLEDFYVEESNPIFKSENGCLINIDKNEIIAGTKNVIIPNYISKISDDAFSNCNGLESIEIPDSIIEIGERAFSECINLKSISIPDSVTVIGDGAFRSCGKLKSIRIPDGVKTLNGTFSFCTSLESVIIPDSVTSIGSFTFSNCTSLTEVILPDSIKSIEAYAFVNCYNLYAITIPESVIEMGTGVFCYWEYNQVINLSFDCGDIPIGWHEDWLNECNAKINWNA